MNIKPGVLSKNTITLFYKSNQITLHKSDWLRLACCLYFSMFSWAQWQHYVSVVDESVYPIVMNTPTWPSRHWFKKKKKKQTNCTFSESHCSFNSLKKKKSRTLIQFSAELHKHSRITSMDKSRFTVQQHPKQDILPTLLTLQNNSLCRAVISQQRCIAGPWMVNEAAESWRLFSLLNMVNDIRGSSKRGLREHEEGWRLSTH